MTQKVFSGFAADGSRAWDAEDKSIQAAFWEDVKASPAWDRYRRDYGATEENGAIVISTLETLYGTTTDFSANQLLDALITSLDSGAIPRKPAEVVPPTSASEPAPVDRNGKPLSRAQIQWGKYAEFANTHSSAECRERARTDAGFRSFVTKNLQREMTESGVGDAVVPLNQSSSPTKAAMKDQRLVAFADTYRNMSSAEVRSRKSAASNPFGAAQFMKDINDCISLGLI